MRSFTACFIVLAALLAALATPAAAAQLQEVGVDVQPYYIDVRLGFNTKPAYTESFRYDPDRYLLTFTNCGLAVPAERIAQLEAIGNNLLTRISLYAGSDNIAVGFYLNQRVEPFIRYDETSYYLRFYTAARFERVTQLARGVSLTEKTSVYQGENFHLYMVKVDPAAEASVFAAAADRYDGKTRRRAPSSFGRRENALAVVNGGFFGSAGEHLGTLVEDGIIRATGVYPTRPMFVITQNSQRLIGRYNVSTALIADGTRIPVSAKNYPFEPGKVIVYNDRYPIETLPQNGMYYYLIEGGRMRYYSASTSGLWLAPDVLLVATDIIPEANPLRQVPDGAAVSLETRITDEAGQVIYAQSAIGGAPMLVQNGAVNITSDIDKVRADISKSERSRTAVGLTQSGTLLLAVVKEVESAGYGGVTLQALAQLMLDEGAYTAMNLDGGGSSAMVVAGELLNLSEANERPVSNVLVVAPAPGGSAPASQGGQAVLKYNRQEQP
jgi:exopolysaccharide biosynthesis protein